MTSRMVPNFCQNAGLNEWYVLKDQSTPNAKEFHQSIKELPKSTKASDSKPDMPPKPYDDLFIEPAGDYDVVYGDSNST
ncbi:unnamed protein product [Dracunculus medinensis]|uniref:Retrovirus-related Pol polyprotein from transposon TNT 1-94 n=1 Tax=Dracunculus medinensis TaxID=318479 RepID=A0A0N4U345_DRAME|nr:unnamed protein product [Dracunculus medinensis]